MMLISINSLLSLDIQNMYHGKSANNRYGNSPARMADGRNFTDYRQHCVTEADLRQQAGTRTSDFAYRAFLQNNGTTIMQNIRRTAVDANAFRVTPGQKSAVIPERFITMCNSATCVKSESNPSGLGNGRNNGASGTVLPYNY
ncbi:MAG: hypothetical protein F2563_02240 [Actinobacteria bacterium]|jgi:hypothetical protein|nr:hypothetical protein [Actinomycetota bacterium]